MWMFTFFVLTAANGCSEDDLEALKHSLIGHYRSQFNNPYEADDPLLPPRKYLASYNIVQRNNDKLWWHRRDLARSFLNGGQAN